MTSRRLPPKLLPRLPKPTDLSAQIRQRSKLSAKSCHDATDSAADPARAVSLLAERNWFERINSEFAGPLRQLGPRFVVRALQHAAAEPLLCVRLYVWASRFGQHFARDRCVRRALGDALWRHGPVVLSAALVAEVQGCGCVVSEELLCALVESWGRLGLAHYAHEVFVQMPRLGLRPSTMVYNAVIAASVCAGAVDAAYLRFQQMPADGCRPDCFTLQCTRARCLPAWDRRRGAKAGKADGGRGDQAKCFHLHNAGRWFLQCWQGGGCSWCVGEDEGEGCSTDRSHVQDAGSWCVPFPGYRQGIQDIE